MYRESARTRGRWLACVAVLWAHGWAIQLLVHLPGPSPRVAILERLVLVSLPPPERARPPAGAVPHRAAGNHRSRTQPAAGDASANLSPGGSAEPAVPSIDWLDEQRRAAASNAPQIWQRQAQHCRDAAALHVYPPECHRYIAPDAWEPVEKRFGLEGPLPYVRVGRCVVGLGFWGCSVGKPPPPNGHAFDGMQDPDRPASVPENGGYRTPSAGPLPLH